MSYHFTAIPNSHVRNIRGNQPDANGQIAQRIISDGGGNPCRCCLDEIPAGMEMLVLAYRPFQILNPYAEIGPIFLCSECSEYNEISHIPPVLRNRPRHLFKGYSTDDRIVYGTGEIVETNDLIQYLTKTFANPLVAYIHVRSALNGCFTLRIDRS